MSEPIREVLMENEQEQLPEAPAAPMHFHRFLTGFLLWLLAAVHVFQAAWIFAGKIYYTADVRAQVYAGIPGLRIVDYALAAALVIAAALFIAARGKLKGLKVRGIHLLLAGCALITACWPLHALARFIIAGLSPLNIAAIARLIGGGALLLVNRSYYRKRRSAFH